MLIDQTYGKKTYCIINKSAKWHCGRHTYL